MTSSRLRGAVTGAAAVLLSSCALLTSDAGYPAGVDPTVRASGEVAPAVSIDARALPRPLADRQLVDLGWEAHPHETDGVFVGLGTASEQALRFSAVRSDGTILWDTERPLSCTGFALTSDGDRPLAVLTDLSPGTTSVAVTTASAYDLHTGELVWGPVEVPGPHAGPGLVFADVVTGGAMGAGGPRVALDPATGDVAASEEELDGARIVGEFHGTVLIADDAHLVAHRASADGERWRLPLAEHGLDDAARVAAAPDSTPGPGLAFVGDREPGYALVDLVEGSVLATGVQDTATDPHQGVHVTVGHERLSGYDDRGERIWDVPVDPGTRIASAGGGVLYLVAGDRVTTRDSATGRPLETYDDPGPGGAALPRHHDAAGATVLETSQGLLLATTDGSGPAGTALPVRP